MCSFFLKINLRAVDGQPYYEPTENGAEATIKARLTGQKANNLP
jgi:hypothetical protein